MQPSRLHQEGKLSFRRRVRRPLAADLPFADGTREPPAWDTLVPDTAARVEIEVGSGKGTFLMAAAPLRPATFFLGVEASPPYAQYTADRARRAGLANLYMLADNARMFLRDRVPAAAVDVFHVYYPDPWPKRRHRKRRFFQSDTAAALARGLKDDGLLLIATDSTAYFGEILALVGGCAELRRDWALETRLGDGVAGEAFQPTNFQIKYAATGRTLNRCAFRRQPRAATALDPMVWTPLVALQELADQQGRQFDVNGQEVALFRAGDQVFALQNSCPHRGAALAEGIVSDGQVACSWHGWRFDLATGQCRTIPGEVARTFPTRVHDGMVEVGMLPAATPG